MSKRIVQRHVRNSPVAQERADLQNVYSNNEERSTEKNEFAGQSGTGKRKAQEVQKEVINHGTWRFCLGKAADKVEEKRNEPMHVLALVDDCWMKPVLLKPSSNNVAVDSASIAAKIKGNLAARPRSAREHVKKNCLKICSQCASGTRTGGCANVYRNNKKGARKKRSSQDNQAKGAKGTRNPKRSS